jgi:hypothetical protein
MQVTEIQKKFNGFGLSSTVLITPLTGVISILVKLFSYLVVIVIKVLVKSILLDV